MASWAPSLRGKSQWVAVSGSGKQAAEAEPDFFEMEVFQMLDTDSDGHVALQDLEPLLVISPKLRRVLKETSKHCRHPASGLSLREFAAAFRGDNCVSTYYQNMAAAEFDDYMSSSTCSQPKPQVLQPPVDTNPLCRAFSTGDLHLATEGAYIMAAVSRAAPDAPPSEKPQEKILRVSDLEAGLQAAAAASCPSPCPSPSPAIFSTTPTEPLRAPKGVGLQVSTVPIPPWNQYPVLADAAAWFRGTQGYTPHMAGGMLAHSRSFDSLGAEMAKVAAVKMASVAPGMATHDDPVPLIARGAQGAKVGRRGPRKAAVAASVAVPETVPVDMPVESQPHQTSLAQAEEPKMRWRVKESQKEAAVTFTEDVPRPESEKLQETGQLRDALAEIERLKQQVAAAATKDTELQRLKEELAAAKEVQSAGESTLGRHARASTGGLRELPHLDSDSEKDDDNDSEDDEVGIVPAPPDSASWEWPLSRQEKRARVQLLERQMNAFDRSALIKEFRRVSLSSARNSLSSARNECAPDHD